MSSPPLEAVLTIHEAVAWVQYRDVAAVKLASTPDGLASLRVYERFPLIGSSKDLKAVLLSGKLPAQGQRIDGQWHDLTPNEWLTLPIAPRNVERQHPYAVISVSLDDLLKAFPVRTSTGPRGRPTTIDWDWIRKAANEEAITSLTKLAAILEARYRAQFPEKTVSASSIRRKLSEWAKIGA